MTHDRSVDYGFAVAHDVPARCVADAADAAILVPNCPVCHQTVGLMARLLEEQRRRRARPCSARFDGA